MDKDDRDKDDRDKDEGLIIMIPIPRYTRTPGGVDEAPHARLRQEPVFDRQPVPRRMESLTG